MLLCFHLFSFTSATAGEYDQVILLDQRHVIKPGYPSSHQKPGAANSQAKSSYYSPQWEHIRIPSLCITHRHTQTQTQTHTQTVWATSVNCTIFQARNLVAIFPCLLLPQCIHRSQSLISPPLKFSWIWPFLSIPDASPYNGYLQLFGLSLIFSKSLIPTYYPKFNQSSLNKLQIRLYYSSG